MRSTCFRLLFAAAALSLLLASWLADRLGSRRREIARLQRNYEFLTYGLMAAWIILVVYVLMMVSRQKKLKREISNLRAMLDDKR